MSLNVDQIKQKLVNPSFNGVAKAEDITVAIARKLVEETKDAELLQSFDTLDAADQEQLAEYCRGVFQAQQAQKQNSQVNLDHVLEQLEKSPAKLSTRNDLVNSLIKYAGATVEDANNITIISGNLRAHLGEEAVIKKLNEAGIALKSDISDSDKDKIALALARILHTTFKANTDAISKIEKLTKENVKLEDEQDLKLVQAVLADDKLKAIYFQGKSDKDYADFKAKVTELITALNAKKPPEPQPQPTSSPQTQDKNWSTWIKWGSVALGVIGVLVGLFTGESDAKGKSFFAAIGGALILLPWVKPVYEWLNPAGGSQTPNHAQAKVGQ